MVPRKILARYRDLGSLLSSGRSQSLVFGCVFRLARVGYCLANLIERTANEYAAESLDSAMLIVLCENELYKTSTRHR